MQIRLKDELMLVRLNIVFPSHKNHAQLFLNNIYFRNSEADLSLWYAFRISSKIQQLLYVI